MSEGSEEQPKRKAPPGWYPHPSMTATQRYWDGDKWTDNIAPMSAPVPIPQSNQPSQLLIAAILAGAVIGLIMAMQSASLLTGTGTLWTGAAIACGAAIVTWVVKGLPTWVRVVCVIAAALAVTNVVSVESQLEDKRQEINDILK